MMLALGTAKTLPNLVFCFAVKKDFCPGLAAANCVSCAAQHLNNPPTSVTPLLAAKLQSKEDSIKREESVQGQGRFCYIINLPFVYH